MGCGCKKHKEQEQDQAKEDAHIIYNEQGVRWEDTIFAKIKKGRRRVNDGKV